jgi:outer membrane lipoprotein carrier protein
MIQAGLTKLITATGSIRVKQLPATRCLLPTACCLLFFLSTAYTSDVETVLGKMQQRYASADTITGSFVLTNTAPQGIEQVERGVFWLKKPALMKWEYSDPEGMLFIADGKEGLLYDPRDRQVTVQSLTTEELLNTPLKLLLGAGDVEESFHIVPEDETETGTDGAQRVQLVPISETDYSYLDLEIDNTSFDLVRLTIKEQDGNTREYHFTDLKTDVKIEDKHFFRFEIPEGVEIYRE